MAQENSTKQGCKCLGDKKLKALENQINEIEGKINYFYEMIVPILKEIATLRKAVRI